jgi:hypothetical protein
MQEVVWLDSVIRQEAIGRFEPGASSTSFRQGGSGVLGERRGQFDHPLPTAQITQLSLGKFLDGPVSVIGQATHA